MTLSSFISWRHPYSSGEFHFPGNLILFNSIVWFHIMMSPRTQEGGSWPRMRLQLKPQSSLYSTLELRRPFRSGPKVKTRGPAFVCVPVLAGHGAGCSKRGLEPWTPAATANRNKRHNLEPFKASAAGDQGWELQPPKGALGTSREVQWLRFYLPVGSTSGWEAKILYASRQIPHASSSKNQNIKKQKQYCNKFNTGFKSGPH